MDRDDVIKMDRDDVIKRLERACQIVWNGGGDYNLINAQDALYVAGAIHDAIVLLHEQKAVKPEWWQGKAYCGNCSAKLPSKKYDIRFCGSCGCEIDWDRYRGKRSQILTIATPEGVFTITPEGEDEK